MVNIKTINLLKKILQILLAITIVTPIFWGNHFYYPFMTIKVLVFRLLVLSALIVFIIYFLLIKKIKYKITPIGYFFGSLLIVSFLAAVFGINFEHSFWSNMERADGVLFMFYLFIYFILLSFSFKKASEIRWLFRVSLGTSIIIVIYGILQHFGFFAAINTTGNRISSTLGNPAYLGSYALIHVFLALYLLMKDKKWLWKIFTIIGLLLNFWVIFLTQTRGAVIGLVVGLISLAILSFLRGNNRKIKKISILTLIIIVFLSFLSLVFKDSSLIQGNDTLKRVTNISLESYTVKTRLAAWNTSIKAFKERPILGWGPENYGYAFSKYFPSEIYVDSGSKIWFDKAHSVFFEYLVTTGILGVLIYFGLLFSVIYFLFKSKRLNSVTSNIFISLIIGYTLANMFVFDTLSTYMLFVLVLVFVNNIAFKKEEKEINLNYFIIVLLSVLFLFFIFTSYVVNFRAIKDNRKLLIAVAYAREGYIQEAYNNYIDALDYNNRFTRYEISRELAIFVRDKTKGLPDYKVAPMYERAIQEMRKSIKSNPNEIRHYYNLSQLYLRSYKFDATRLTKVIDMGSKMIELAPTRAHTYYQIGEAYILKNDYENALKNFQKAVELNPNVIDTYVNVYAVALLMKDDNLEQKTRERMEEVVPDFFNKEETLVRYLPLYKKVGRGDLLVNSLEKLILLDPTKIEYVSSLAIYYAEQGDNKKAEETIKRLSGRSEELDKKVEEFIKKIYSGYFLKSK